MVAVALVVMVVFQLVTAATVAVMESNAAAKHSTQPAKAVVMV